MLFCFQGMSERLPQWYLEHLQQLRDTSALQMPLAARCKRLACVAPKLPPSETLFHSALPIQKPPVAGALFYSATNTFL
jgi:hypothetical protein